MVVVERAAVDFVRATTRLEPVTFVPEIRLHQARDPYWMWERARCERGDSTVPVPYWAFAWVGGQTLARYLLDHPEEVVGRRVLDLASGSGLVAVAAARAGACAVIANDVDPDALVAVHLNAAANDASVAPRSCDLLDADAAPEEVEVVLAGDVFYDADLASRMAAFLERAYERGVRVLVGDRGREYLPRHRLRSVCDYDVPVPAELEGGDRVRASVLALQ